MESLIIIKLGGQSYAVLDSQVERTGSVPSIHYLPMTPDHFAGVADLQDEMVSLYDISRCMGYDKIDRSAPSHILVLRTEDSTVGFAYNTEGGRVSEGEIKPLPGGMTSDDITGIVVHEQQIIVVIDIVSLYKRAMSAKWSPPSITFESIDTSKASDTFRLFTSGGQDFAAPSKGITEGFHETGRVFHLPIAPPYIAGLTLVDGEPHVLVDTPSRLAQQAESGELLIHTNNSIAISVEADLGEMADESPNVVPLPPIASSTLMDSALMTSGDILPILNMQEMTANPTEPSFADMYKGKSAFLSVFSHADAPISEFSLLGESCAIPAEQVEDVIDFNGYRSIPGIHSIMIGVAPFRDELLPVIDLALCFGLRSIIKDGWKLIVVHNGDFKALVPAPDVSENIFLEMDRQQLLPIKQTYRYVYGCYTIENKVRLILNVKTLTTHFDEQLVSKVFESFYKDITENRWASVAKEYAKADDEAARIAAHEAAGLKAEADRLEAEDDAAKLADEEQAQREAEEAARLAEEEQTAILKEEADRLADEDDAAKLADEEQAQREDEEAARLAAEEQAQRKADEEAARLAAEEQAQREADEEAARLEEEKQTALLQEEADRLADEEDAAKLADEEQAQREDEEAARLAAEEQAQREADEEAARLEEEKQAALLQEEAYRLADEEDAAKLADEEQAQREADEEAARLEEEKQAALLKEEADRLAAEEDAAKLAAEEQAQREADEEAARLAEEEQTALLKEEADRLAAEEDAAKLAAEEQAQREDEEAARLAAEEQAQREAEEAAGLAAEEEAQRIADEEEKPDLDSMAAAFMTSADTDDLQFQETDPDTTSTDIEKEHIEELTKLSEPETVQKSAEEPEPIADSAAFHTERLKQYRAPDKKKSDKNHVRTMLIAAILLLLLGTPIYVMMGEKDKKTTIAKRPVAATVPEQKPQPKPEPVEQPKQEPVEQPKQEPVMETLPIKVEPKIEEPIKQEAVVIYAPPETEPTVHIVRRGDTLWHISKRYMGNPWKYPQVAKKNRIRNPHLIYPGQKIKIVPLKK